MTGIREPVGRALDVLTWIADHPSAPLVVRQIARDLDTSPSTVHRIFQTFQERRLIGRGDDGEYVRGLELYRICAVIANELSLVRVVHPHLQALTEECSETTIFGVYDPRRRQMMFIDRVHALHPLRYVVDLHHWMPIHSGATGLAILAFLPPEERQRIYGEGLPRMTPATLVTPSELEEEVARIRERGYAWSMGQRIPGAVGFAAPVFDCAGNVCGDVCVTLPEQRFEKGQFAESLAGMLVAASQRVSEELKALGYRAESAGDAERDGGRPGT